MSVTNFCSLGRSIGVGGKHQRRPGPVSQLEDAELLVDQRERAPAAAPASCRARPRLGLRRGRAEAAGSGPVPCGPPLPAQPSSSARRPGWPSGSPTGARAGRADRDRDGLLQVRRAFPSGWASTARGCPRSCPASAAAGRGRSPPADSRRGLLLLLLSAPLSFFSVGRSGSSAGPLSLVLLLALCSVGRSGSGAGAELDVSSPESFRCSVGSSEPFEPSLPGVPVAGCLRCSTGLSS